MYIAIDFDGTIVQNAFPDIGAKVPNALYWIKKFSQEKNVYLILWTVRSDDVLNEAVEWCGNNGISFYGINENPDQKEWSTSPKVFAHIYIDDRNAWCPLVNGYVDWNIVGPAVIKQIQTHKTEKKQ